MKRPRFNLRTLAIVVTLVCAYFAAWEATKGAAKAQTGKRMDVQIFVPGGGTKPFIHAVQNTTAPAPFIISLDLDNCDGSYPYYSKIEPKPRHYHLWLFGPMIQLPFESEW